MTDRLTEVRIKNQCFHISNFGNAKETKQNEAIGHQCPHGLLTLSMCMLCFRCRRLVRLHFWSVNRLRARLPYGGRMSVVVSREESLAGWQRPSCPAVCVTCGPEEWLIFCRFRMQSRVGKRFASNEQRGFLPAVVPPCCRLLAKNLTCGVVVGCLVEIDRG